MRACLLLALAATAGCGAYHKIEISLPPEHAGARSVLVAFVAGGEVTLHAIDPAASQLDMRELPTLDDAPDDLELYALGYPSSLASLQIEGPGPVATTAVAPFFPLPEIGAFFSAELGAASFERWRALDVLPPVLAGLRLPGVRDPCPKFRVRRIETGAVINSAAAIDDDRALLVPAEGPYLVVGRPNFEVTEIPVARSAPRNRAHRDAAGKLWVFGSGGEVVEVDPVARTLTARPDMPDGEEISFIDDGAPDAAARLWVLGTRGRFQAFEGGTWVDGAARERMLDDVDADGFIRDWARGIVEIDDKVVTVRRAMNVAKIYEATGGARRLETALGFGAARTTAAYGAVFGALDGELYTLTHDDRFTPLPRSPASVELGLPTYEIQARGDRIYVGGTVGAMAVYLREHGLCRSETVSRGAIEQIAFVGESVVIVGEDEAVVSWLDPE